MSNQWLHIGLLVAGCVIFTMWMYSTQQAMRKEARRRTEELATADRALKSHYLAIEALAEDPATPIGVLKFLADFSDAISSEEMGAIFGERLLEPGPQERSAKRPEWMDEVRLLHKSRPDLGERLHTAVASGLVALLLRWPANAKLFNETMAEFAADARRTRDAANAVVRMNKKRQSGHDDYFSNGLMPA